MPKKHLETTFLSTYKNHRNYQEPQEQEITPTKALDQISPVPKIKPGIRKVGANLGSLLSSLAYIETGGSKKKKLSATTTTPKTTKNRKPLQKAKRLRHKSSSTEFEDMILDGLSSEEEHF